MNSPTLPIDGVLPPDALLTRLRWRYSTKKYDPAQRITEKDWRALEEALVLSASSFGLQPWKFLVVTDPVLRQKLRAAAWNQSQVTDASHVVVFTIKKDLGEDDVDRYISRIAEVRKQPLSELDGYRNIMLSKVSGTADPVELRAWSTRQVYIALGNFLTAAAVLGIDTTPMEGFDPGKFNEILGLSAKGLSAVVVATAGYRAADDAYAAQPKVRFPLEDVVERIG